MRRRLVVLLMAGMFSAPCLMAFAGQAVPGAPPAEEEVAPPPVRRDPISRYLIARGNDFLDIFNIKLSLSDDLSVLVNVRATRLAQIGFGRFSGTKVGFQGPSAGIYGEGRTEVGISVFYWAWIGRKTSPAGITEDAQKTNRFFGRVDDIRAAPTYREFYDANRPWHTIGASFALPFLPGIEAEINPAEAVDFFLSFFNLRGLRIPPPFHKVDVKGERVPAPGCIRWHGQEEFEQYE
ncbi:MAG TPA: hypothetical protein VNE39_10370 [Planctomycetota bacterium]|nr:hypothetical protein [Planctomycetota bacterium]